MEKLKLMKVKVAAPILGITEQALRLGLQQKVFPFGVAVKHKEQYRYYIFEDKFDKYIKKEEFNEEKKEIESW